MGILDLFIEYRHYYFVGMKYTVLISILALVIGTTLGALMSLMKLSKIKFVRFLASAYIEVVRGTPMMVQISLVYFGSYVLTGIDMDAFLAALVAVSLNSTAYVAEIIRSGIQSVDKGQTEASRSLGLSSGQTMRHVVLPQAIKNILPAMGNEFVTLIKETSVASTIGVAELMLASRIVQAASWQPFYPLVIIAVMYFVFTFSLSQLIGALERRLAHND